MGITIFSHAEIHNMNAVYDDKTGEILCMGYAKSFLYNGGNILCRGTTNTYLERWGIMMVSHEINNICGVYNGVDVLHGVAYPAQNFSCTIWEKFCVPYAKFLLYSMGKQHGVGVRYINHSIPIYIGEILHTPMQNLSYIIEECISN